MNEQALKGRLKHIAAEQKRTVQEVWRLILLERLLVRLSHSKYQNKFIFKGGLLLSYYLLIARETTDIDLLARRLHAEMPRLEEVLVELCSTDANDGFVMSFESIEELEHNHMNYPGYRAKIRAQFGTMRDRIQVDIGVGDSVEPVSISWPLFQYKGEPIFEDAILLQVYSVEAIFSEKLETVVSRGAANSRMKDFHDILLLCRKNDFFDMEKLRTTIKSTFQNRKTEMKIPITFTEDEYSRLQLLWSGHLRTLSDATRVELEMPKHILDLIKEINSWLARVRLTLVE